MLKLISVEMASGLMEVSKKGSATLAIINLRIALMAIGNCTSEDVLNMTIFKGIRKNT